MALSETAKLLASLELKDKFSPTISKVNKSLNQFDAKLDRSSTRSFRAGQQIGTGIKNGAKIAAIGVGLVVTQVALGLRSLVELEQQQAQTAAVLKSTGQIAGITGQKVTELADKFESLNATVGDEFIRAGENMLLTFTNIRGQAFEPALAAALDLNTALGKGPEGLTKTVITVGKALNDPTQGLTALRKVGVSFDKGQIKRIKSLQKEGKLYEAQQIILKELGKEFGGSFAAGGQTAAGKVAKFSDAVEDLQRSLAVALLPAVSNIADALSDLLKDPEVIKGAEDLGKSIGELFSKDNIKTGAKIVGDVISSIRTAAPIIATSLGVVAKAVGTAVDAFSKLPEPIKQLLIGGFVVNKLTGGLVTNIAGGLFDAFKSGIKAPLVNVSGGVVNVGGGVPGGGRGIPGVGGIPGAGGAATAAGGAAAGFGLLTVSVLAIAPVALAGLALAITSQTDPTGNRNRQGKADTATARGVPDENNKALQEIKGGVGQLRDKIESSKIAGVAGTAKVIAATNVLRDKIESGTQKGVSAADRTRAAAEAVRDRVESTKIAVTSGVEAAASRTVEAIHGIPAPVVNLYNNIDISATTVQQKSVVIKRYGMTGGSKNTVPGKKP